MAFLGQEEQIRELQDRFRYLYAVLFIALGILVFRLVYLQILAGDRMRLYSEENRIKRVKISAPRGMIFDRNRTLLIDNRPAFDLEIIPQYLRESRQMKAVVQRLARIIKVPENEITDILEKAKTQPAFMPVKIKTSLSRDEAAEIELWKIDMPGVEIREEIKRTNVYGEIASHLLGYIGEVSALELPQINRNSQRYKLGDSIGKYGLEQRMEETLRGVDGEELKEVDALGRIKLDHGRGRVLDAIMNKPAVPGKNLILTIDQDTQNAAAQAMGDKVGSVVALDPRTGEILAMLSRPSFDPTEFSRGISPGLWAKLINNPNRPLRDKTIQDHYSPGSTFKILTAIAGLQEGVIDEHTTFNCTGSMRVGNRVYHCWSKHGHGNVDVVTAITRSCDVFFYKLAMKLKSVDDIAKWAKHMGIGHKTGINLAREVPGLIPTEEWKQKRFGEQWNAGETLSVAIGQSYVLTTALQLANAYAALGNGGTLWKPYVVKEVESYEGQVLKEFKPEVLDKTNLKPKTVELVKAGLWGVTNTPGGTAYSHRLPGMDFVGKTGTVQIMRMSADKLYGKCENWKFGERHNGLFVGFAPAKDPVIAVAVIGEHVCHGASGAAPIAQAIVKAYLEKTNPALYGKEAIAERLKREKELNPKPVKVREEQEDISPDVNEALPKETRPAIPAPPAGVAPEAPTEESEPDSGGDEG